MSDPGAGSRTSRWYHDPVRPLDERDFCWRHEAAQTAEQAREAAMNDERTQDQATASADVDVAAEPLTTPAAASESLAPAYTPRDIEPRIYARWMEADVFAPDGRGSPADMRQLPFVIIQPPPNVTGALH